jgi:hypothetical protein
VPDAVQKPYDGRRRRPLDACEMRQEIATPSDFFEHREGRIDHNADEQAEDHVGVDVQRPDSDQEGGAVRGGEDRRRNHERR